MDSPEYEMTRDELLGIVRQRVWRAHQMTLEDYIEARRTGSLERTVADSELDGYFDDFSTAIPPKQSKDSEGGKGPAHLLYASIRRLREQRRRATAGA